MTIPFYKYQGTGNDFVLIDGFKNPHIELNQKQVHNICDRHFGIGGDGLIILKPHADHDFEMVYYNSDGNQSTMCGNGGRCAVAFAKQLGIIQDKTNFLAIDGPHSAYFINDNVALQMQHVNDIQSFETFYQLNTGSPHYVSIVDAVSDIKVDTEGALIRYSPRFKEEGINVNFVEVENDTTLFVRTYERGVEDETLSCGTGVTAAALVQMMRTGHNEIAVNTLGGGLRVKALNQNGIFENIELIGPAQFVFAGEINV